MAEKAYPWNTASGGAQAPSGGYTADDFRRANRAMFGDGVFRRINGVFNGNLAVSAAGQVLTIQPGGACVAGLLYSSDAATTLNVASVGSTTGGRVVVAATFGTQLCQILLRMSATGTSTPPALTQTDGTLYEISLATFTITSGGVITLTDTRQFVQNGATNAVETTNRQGGSSTDATVQGNTNYALTGTKLQAGTKRLTWPTSGSTTSAYVTVTFPVPFTQKPIPMVCLLGEQDASDAPISLSVMNITSTEMTIHANRDSSSTSGLVHDVSWMAIGPHA